MVLLQWPLAACCVQHSTIHRSVLCAISASNMLLFTWWITDMIYSLPTNIPASRLWWHLQLLIRGLFLCPSQVENNYQYLSLWTQLLQSHLWKNRKRKDQGEKKEKWGKRGKGRGDIRREENGLGIGFSILCQHYFEHNHCCQASSIKWEFLISLW